MHLARQHLLNYFQRSNNINLRKVDITFHILVKVIQRMVAM